MSKKNGITLTIESNTKNSAHNQTVADTEAQANRLKFTHEQEVGKIKIKKIDLDDNLRKHIASTNVHGDINLWSRQLIDIKKAIRANQLEIEIAAEITEEFFT